MCRFWMCWADFVSLFGSVEVCVLERSIADLQMDEHEHLGPCGTVLGCTLGCLYYWSCCAGLRRLWCTRESSTEYGVKQKHRAPKVAPS